MHASVPVLTTLLAAAACAAACSSGAPETGSEQRPAATVPAEEPAPPRQAEADAPAPTVPVRFAALREGRAFEGAPPVIAHPIGLGTECTECHLDGSDGFDDPDVPPPTPHPELANCRMCHVYVNTGTTFRENAFEPVRYALGQQLNELSPPLIPHPLTLRERCVVCHNHGEASSARWRDDLEPLHSEAWNCSMCHVPATTDAPGPRPGATPLPSGAD